MTPGLAAWKLAFQISPIILTGGGLTSSIPGGMLPLIAITEAINFPDGLLSGGSNIELDNFFANFTPVQGASLIDQDIGRYPFANQQVAANAVIAQPLTISMHMMVPVRNSLGYAAKLAIMIALQTALAKHNATGGTYIIATPSYIYTDCVMRSMRDVSSSVTKQAQNAWQLDFEKPLITLAQAQDAQSSLMSKFSSLLPNVGQPAFSGLQSAVGQSISLAGSSVIPSAAPGLATGTIAVPGFTPAAGSIVSSPLAPL